MAIFIVGALLLSCGYFFTLAPNKNDPKEQFYEVKKGISTRDLAADLQEKNFIRSYWLFFLYLKYRRAKIQAGIYQLSPSYNLSKQLQILIAGPKEEVVTFPEGYTLREMAELLEKKNLVKKEDFLTVASAAKDFVSEFPFLSAVQTNSLEGYLFPDTYRFTLGMSAFEIIRKMLTNFDQKVNLPLSPQIQQQKYTLNEVLILASIVEREAKNDAERPKIAAVYLNRLEKKMKLEADPTVAYAKGSWAPITAADYRNVDSPYNTYKYFGLPPTPIANPGLSSIQAVLRPASFSALYFFHTKTGEIIFSETAQEHLAKQKEYLK